MEDTQNNEALIAEALRDAQLTEIPSSLRDEPVIHRGDETLEAPMTVKEISSAGYVWIWDSRTFEKAPCLYYMLPYKLRQRRPDGSFIFRTTDPGELPKRGEIKCMLHPDAENRKHYALLGFRTCPKDNITNPYQLTQHMKKKHPQEWAAIEKERLDAEKQEDRELTRMLLKAQMPQEVAINPMIMAPQRELGDNEYFCKECQKVHRKTSKLGKKHKK